ncbi:hypothetical protein [Bradyrhizobium sp.]|uniref:hypothetical protein n=1 Tax=Bradyrhizobium sp. TaxID=376 RepID=UPI0025C58D8D|nr:hypothetical protein [Bradyrhizobium sp.]
MPFSTTSYLAGVGSVVAALAVGFSGGFLLATPTQHVEQNRLQRVTSSAPISIPAPPTSVATSATEPKIVEESAARAPVIEQPGQSAAVPVMAKAVEPPPAQVIPKPPEPRVAAQEIRAAEAKAAERRRAKEQRLAEQRKQREIERATVVVKRMLRDRDQQVAERTDTPRFGFFGED